MNHKKYNFTNYLLGRATAEERQELEKHLATCAECRKELARFKVLFQAFKQIEAIEPASNFTHRVMQEVERLPRPVPLPAGQVYKNIFANISRKFQGAIRYSPAWALSGAIHLFLFAIIALILIQPTQQRIEKAKLPRIDDGAQMLMPTARTGTPPPETTPAVSMVSLTYHEVDDERFLAHLTDGRAPEKRRALLARYGGDETTERAVADGLKWLSQAQESDGSWNARKYGGLKEYQIGITGLSLLTFLTDGSSSRNGPYQKTVHSGIDYLAASQQTSGLFGAEREGNRAINYMYNQGIATLAILEDYVMCRNNPAPDVVGEEIRRNQVMAAVNFIICAQNAQGGWGYQAHNGVDDTSVTVWQMAVLRIARALKIPGASEALTKAGAWLASVTDENGYVGYQALNQYPNGVNTTTAAGMFAQLFIGADKTNKVITEQTKMLAQQLPKTPARESANDFYFWHFGALAMFQAGGTDWLEWNKHLKETVVKGQEPANTANGGSWEPRDRWGTYGGRLFTTSVAILTLQTYYRYPAS